MSSLPRVPSYRFQLMAPRLSCGQIDRQMSITSVWDIYQISQVNLVEYSLSILYNPI